eukprot:5030467-Amphidinium_carterae.1
MRGQDLLGELKNCSYGTSQTLCDLTTEISQGHSRPQPHHVFRLLVIILHFKALLETASGRTFFHSVYSPKR